MAGIRTCDRESQVQRPNHYTTEPLAIATAVLSTNCTYPQTDGQAELAWTHQYTDYTLMRTPQYYPSINQSINARFVERRYTTRPGAPTIVSDKHDQKVHS